MASGKRPTLALALVCLGACDPLTVLVPRANDAGTDAGEGEGETAGEGEGEAVDVPRCYEEPDLWPNATLSACEPDVDTCDRIGDNASVENDIVQIWSRVERDRFVVMVEFLGPLGPIDNIQTFSIFVAFDTDGSFEQLHQHTGDPLCTQLTGYWTSTNHGPGYDQLFTTVFADEAFDWIRADSTVFLGSTMSLDCELDVQWAEERFLRLSFPHDRVVGPNGTITYSVHMDAGNVDILHPEVLTGDDLAFGTCTWMTSRGGSPDGELAFATYAPCDDTLIFERGCTTPQ